MTQHIRFLLGFQGMKILGCIRQFCKCYDLSRCHEIAHKFKANDAHFECSLNCLVLIRHFTVIISIVSKSCLNYLQFNDPRHCTPCAVSTQRDPGGHRVVWQFAPADAPPKHSLPRGLSTQLEPGLQITVRQLEAPRH